MSGAAGSGKRLSTAERAALLRVVRERIESLNREAEILQERIARKIPGTQIALDLVQLELTMLASAVRKLWTGGNGHA